MTSTSSHSGAGPPPPLTSSVPSTYTTQTLPVAVPLPDFWRQQPPSQRHLQHPSTQQHYAQQQQSTYHYVNAPVSASLVMPSSSSSSLHASSSRSTPDHQQQPPPTTINANPQQQPLQSSQPTVYYAQPHSQPSSGVYYRGGPQSTDSSSTSSLPVQYHHYPVASTSTSSFRASTAQATKSDLKTATAFSSKNVAVEKENVRPASPKPTTTTKKAASQRGRSATVETTHQERSIEAGPGPDTPTAEDGDSSFDDAELTARFSSVSQIEAQPTLDPETGEAVYPCPFCDKHYGGKHARSIWRRHLSNKHGIPLNIQPRRTRWDNDLNRPKDEAERHKRTLESKRRWAAKNRAEKRAKRKGTTVEEELGLIEAAEAAEAAAAAAAAGHNYNSNTNTNASGSVHDDEDNAGADESFTSQDGQSTSGPMQAVTQQQGQPLHQLQHQHQHPQGYWQDGPQIQQHLPVQPPQTSEHPYPTTSSSQFQYAHPQHPAEQLQMEAIPVQHVRYASHPPPQLQYVQQQQVTYLEGNAGHQPYTIVYPTYTLSPDPNTSARFQRSPSQPDCSTHVHHGVQYNASVSPVDASFQHQQGQYMQTIYQQVPVRHPTQGPSAATASLLQTTPLAQQPFLAPPSSTAASSGAPSLQRSLSAPIATSGPVVYNRHNPPRLHQLPPAASQGVSTSGVPVAYVQHHHQPAHYAMQTSDEQHQQQQMAQAPDAAASVARPASSNSGVTIYIPPPPPSTQAWSSSNAEHATPLAHPVPIYVQGQQQGQGQLQDGQSQMPPTPYFYLSVPPESTPIAEQQTPVVYAVRPIPTPIQIAATVVPPQAQANAQEVLPVVEHAMPQAQAQQNVSDAAASEQALPDSSNAGNKTMSVQVSLMASTKSSKKKPSADAHQNSTTAKKTQKQSVSANVAHSTKTYQEAAMQLLALKTASSSPPASPVKDYFAGGAGGVKDVDEDEDEDEDDDGDDDGKNVPEEELDAEMWRSTDAEGSFAEVEDSGYAPYHDDHDDLMRHSKAAGFHQSNSTNKDRAHQSIDEEEEEEDDEDEESTRRARLRFASIPPSSPAPVRMSLSPESSPMPMSMPTVPSKLSATYLRAQQASTAAGNIRSTPVALQQKKRKLTAAAAAVRTENDENARHDIDGSSDVEPDDNDEDEDDDGDDDDEDGERISLDSSPVQEDEDMKAPLAKRRLISMSSASPRSRIRHGGGQHIITSTSGISDSRSPSPSRYTSAHSSSFATSVLMSTPHLGGDDIHGPRQQHSQAGNGLFFAGTGGGGQQRNDEGGNIISKRGYSHHHHHRSSIFKIDNCSRPSAGLSGMAGAASSSSPSRPFLLSSPEHAAVSKSLGLVPDNFTASHNNNTSFALPPSDSEVGFEMNSFLRGFNSIDNGTASKNWKRGQKQYGLGGGNAGVGLSEYAKDVFGGPI